MSNIYQSGKHKIVWNETQKRILLSNRENMVVAGGIGAGKSYAVLYKIRQIMLATPGSIWLIGRNTLKDLKTDTYEIMFGTNGMFKGLGRFNKIDNEFQMFNGSKIFFKHFDDPDALRGPSISGVFFEQAELIKKEVFETMTGRLRLWGDVTKKTSLGYRYMKKYGNSLDHIQVPQHYFFLVANPHPGSWIKEKFIDKENPAWDVILTTTFDNKDNLPADYIDKLKAEHNELWIQRYIYGSWDQAEGLVYPEFDMRHVIDPMKKISTSNSIYIALDPGYQHANVALFTAMIDGKLTIIDEVYETGKTISEVCVLIKSKLREKFGGFLEKFDITYLIDPSANRKEMGTGQSIKSMYVDAGINPINADNESKAARHVIKDLLKNDKIAVCANCVNTIREFNTHKWHPTKPDEVIKLSDDALDCLKYIVNFQPSFKNLAGIVYKGPDSKSREYTQQYMNHIFTEATKEEQETSHKDHWGLI